MLFAVVLANKPVWEADKICTYITQGNIARSSRREKRVKSFLA